MNYATINIYAKVGDLVQIVGFVEGTQNIIMRVGRLAHVDQDTIVLKPHNTPLIEKAYGSEIEAIYDIHRLEVINEVLVLSDDEAHLKKVVQENLEQEL